MTTRPKPPRTVSGDAEGHGDGACNDDVAFTAWGSTAQLELGECRGTRVRGGIEIALPVRTGGYRDPFAGPAPGLTGDSAISYEAAWWVSPPVEPGFAAEELVASWNAATPPGSWLEVGAEVRRADGSWTASYLLGRWAESSDTIHPTTDPNQADEFAEVACEVLRTRPGRSFSAWRLVVTLYRVPGTGATPRVWLAGGVASRRPRPVVEQPRGSADAAGVRLAVPAYSQHVPRGAYDGFHGGADTWCSPTSTMMVLHHWGRGPQPDEYAEVPPDVPDPFIVHAVHHTYDWAYRGAGNWSFNAAYASRYGVRAFVTRLRSLAEAELFLRAGIPLVAAVSFTRDELTGAGYGTDGHLLVICGFTADGDVVVNDPASHSCPSNAEVPVVYDRAELERVWLGTSGGVVYVVHPIDVGLPPSRGNW